MKIYKVIVDKKPMFCSQCKLGFIETLDCGSRKKFLDNRTGCGIVVKVPDERCLITVVGESEVEEWLENQSRNP